ncbi:cytochrome c oxidase assembly protein [Litchfieldella xinjiangensis]|uniref:cytochrome c oxidase assembly protein n=1 Tax=Litchfieldella xinjiangensis TaxID=1166948 RepID=UPI000694D84D|nr:cytochrome c oxidase assembly protein [Halomonas xinjiangensis]
MVALVLVGVLTVAYLWAAYGQRRRWSHLHTWAFLAGSGVLILALSPPVAHWAHHDLRGHMVQHLAIGMLVSLAWVLAAPMTLLLRQLPTPYARRVVAWLQSAPVRVIAHPCVTLLLNIGGMYLLYLTPLFVATQHSPILHHWLHFHFLVAGYLFCWSILAAPDATPHRVSRRLRLGVLTLSIAAHGVLGKLMYGYGWPRGTSHSLEDIQAAAQLMYYGGDLAEALLAIALFSLWYRRSGRRRAGFATRGVHEKMPIHHPARH